MKKRNSLIASILTIFLVSFVSALSPLYGSFSIRNFLYGIDPMTITLFVVFFIVFALVFFSLTRVIKNKYKEPNVAISGVIAFCIALFTIYWLNRSGMDWSNFFYNLGISSDILSLVVGIILLLIAIWMVKKWGFGAFLIIFGSLMILISLISDFFYERGVAFTIGLVLDLLGIWLWRRRKKKRSLGRPLGGTPHSRFNIRTPYTPRRNAPPRQNRRDRQMDAYEEYAREQNIREGANRRREERRRRQEQREAEERQRREQEEQRRRQVEEQRRRQEEEYRRQQEAQQRQAEQQQRRVRRQQTKEEKQRRKALRNVNKSLENVEKMLMRTDISNKTRKNLEKRKKQYILAAHKIKGHSKNIRQYE